MRARQEMSSGGLSCARMWCALALAAAAGGCSVPAPRAQVLVTIDAEPGVAMYSQAVRIRMWGRDTSGAFEELGFLEETGSRYPWTVAMRPEGEDVSRVFRFEAMAFTGTDPERGNFLAQARVISGYEPGRVLHVYLLLQDACLGVPCEQLSDTCRDGRCEVIPERPTLFDPDAGFPDGGPPPGRDTCAPDMIERCDRLDNDCDGRVDEGFDLLSDPDHCGGCGNSCERPNASGTCIQGRCRMACDPGFADCNDDAVDGCEAALIERDHCGACARRCDGEASLCEASADGYRCVASCTIGVECGGSCVDLETTPQHCGACGDACPTGPHVVTTCEGGECAHRCADGRDSCNGPVLDADGCEQDVTRDPAHCGGCHTECVFTACTTPVCQVAECAQRAVDDARPCDLDMQACTLDFCMAGECRPGPAMGCPLDGGVTDGGGSDAGADGGRLDGGVDAGRLDGGSDGGGDGGQDAGSPGDSDAGASCGTSCGSSETCCGTVCCAESSGDMCCGPSACCRMGMQTCIGLTCQPIEAQDASVVMFP